MVAIRIRILKETRKEGLQSSQQARCRLIQRDLPNLKQQLQRIQSLMKLKRKKSLPRKQLRNKGSLLKKPTRKPRSKELKRKSKKRKSLLPLKLLRNRDKLRRNPDKKWKDLRKKNFKLN